jgi:hypothetical protein
MTRVSMRWTWALVLVAGGAVFTPACVIKATTGDSGTGGTTGATGTPTTSTTVSATATGSVTATVGSGGATGSTTSGTTGGAGGSSSGTGGAPTDSGIADASRDAWQDGGSGVDSCDQCMVMKCLTEMNACLNDSQCFTGDPMDPGQYETVIACVEQLRTMRAVKRIDLRTCGLRVGTGSAWPPVGMADTTTDVINCMATGQTMIPMNNSWADSQNVTQPWAPDSCAKLACTSMVQ